jgi:hypothetical protein
MVDPKPSSTATAKFAQAAAASLADGSFVRLAISSPVNPTESAGKILGRCILLKGAPQLSLTFRHASKDVTKNIPAAASDAWLREQLGTHYRSALLGTTKLDWQFISKATVRRIISATRDRLPARARSGKASLLDSRRRMVARSQVFIAMAPRASMAENTGRSPYLEILCTS